MPYPRTLHEYTLPEFFKEPPPEWERRLREISPELPNLDRLVFRYFEPTNPDGSDRGWLNPERGQWMLYTAKDIRLVDQERAEQFKKHWSEVPVNEQPGHQAVVSNYQHFMWHAKGLYVKPFLILQGEWGGTPAKYTKQEKAFLQASGCVVDEFQIGDFPACPFDERVVKQITLRDRLLLNSNSYEHLARMETSDYKKAEDDAAELVKRQTCLATFREMIQPSLEFMKSYLRTKEADRVLPRAPEGLSNTLDQWRDHFLQTGAFMSPGSISKKKIQVAVG